MDSDNSRKRTVSRRQFLVGTAVALGGSALALAQRLGSMPAVHGQDPTPAACLPIVARNYPPRFWGKVVHVHNDSATTWAGQSDYWNYVNQDAVDVMVDRGLIDLTGAATVADAWRVLLPAYQPGQKIAVKVNLVNSASCGDTDGEIDALIQPVNSLVRSLIEIGVAPADVCVYDAIRAMPDRFVGQAQYGMSFFDDGSCRANAGFSYVPETLVTFYPPSGVTVAEEHVTDLLMNAAYLINMPIMKGHHPLCGVTLGFKNHFGTIDQCWDLHNNVDVVNKPPAYRIDYNPLVDLIRSPLIGGKTVLIVGDGLFAARYYDQSPEPWTTFENKVPNSLFFARDPVSIDCVMHDLLLAELGADVPEGTNNYLRLAGESELGIFEQGNPWQEPYGSGYNSIQYTRVEI
ncbi:MAG: DUF362 domain-containing protein [Anaerolineae bacterium]|nr:DUF362 domain-containing protein [Anaerolineae bacterium]